MSTKRLRWFIGIIAAEVLLLIAIMVYSVVHNDTPPASPSDNSAMVADNKSLTTTLLTTGLADPIGIAAPPIADDSRLFIVEQAGRIVTVDTANPQDKTLFLDITSKVGGGGERGLLGLAFHPAFQQNGQFFVNYTDKAGNTVVARYQTGQDGTGDASSEKVLLTQQQPFANHNGGALQFGPDGYLYIALGDGGSGGDPGNRAQDTSTFLGKILRIDVNKGDPYAVPPTNPLVNQPGAKPEIWAWGLRNPWRISFDRQTGDIWIADVGQGDWEEINLQPVASSSGGNYGWRCFEGTHPFNTVGCQDASAYIQPIYEYDHSGDKCSVTGGYVYRGTQHPSLSGTYLFGDYCSGEIFALEQTNGQATVTAALGTPYAISAFGEDANGELYVADHQSGSIYRIVTE